MKLKTHSKLPGSKKQRPKSQYKRKNSGPRFSTLLCNPEAYSEPSPTSKVECFAKIVNGFQRLHKGLKTLHIRSLEGFWISLCNPSKYVMKVSQKYSQLVCTLSKSMCEIWWKVTIKRSDLRHRFIAVFEILYKVNAAKCSGRKTGTLFFLLSLRVNVLWH